MSLVSFCSAKGSPGVSTLAIALGQLRSMTSQTVVLEADADGGVAAARLGLSYEPGLADLLSAFRRETPDPGEVLRFRQVITDRFGIVTGSGSADEMTAALSLSGLGVAVAAGSIPDTDVFADLGRVSARSPQLCFAARSVATLLVARPTIDEIQTLPSRVDSLIRAGAEPVLVCLGDRPYDPRDVADHLGVELFGVWVDDPTSAQSVWTGTADKRVIRSAWWRSTTTLADRVDALLTPTYAPIAAVGPGALPVDLTHLASEATGTRTPIERTFA